MKTAVVHMDALDQDGFLKQISGWTHETAQELAERNDLGPLTEVHWMIIDYVREYYRIHGEGPPIVKIGKAIGMSSTEICELFPCGIAKGAYRLAGLPRPHGCL